MGLRAGFFGLVHPIGLIHGGNDLGLGALAGLLGLLTSSSSTKPQVVCGLVGGIYFFVQLVSESLKPMGLGRGMRRDALLRHEEFKMQA